jgi:holliday junction DNA helicase RuvA
MIARVAGQLVAKDVDRADVMTAGGIGFEISIPLNVFESLPPVGSDVALHTYLVVREDGWQLFGFSSAYERRVFRTLLAARGIGPALALNLLSSLTAERLVRAIREKDVTTLRRVPRMGPKKAEGMVLDLADKLEELYEGAPTAGAPVGRGTVVDDAVRGLVQLGFTRNEAERAVRSAVDRGAATQSASELIRAAFAVLGSAKGRTG